MTLGTSIEWCDATFNPWWGCEKVSPGCAHCYADPIAHRYAGDLQLWGDGHVFKFASERGWQQPLAWARTLPAKLGRRPRVFCASMGDVFEERDEVDLARYRLFDLICATPELDWLVLTKRPEFARDWLRDLGSDETWPYMGHALRMELEFGLPKNLWLGVSIENARFTWRADVLREIPAAVRFISAEPLLGSLFPTYNGSRDADTGMAVPVLQVDRAGDRVMVGDRRGSGAGLRPAGGGAESASARPASDSSQVASKVPAGARYSTLAGGADEGSISGAHVRQVRAPLSLTGIDWVIIGGESGPRARSFDLEHAREIVRARAACDSRWQAAPALFVKQFGAKPIEHGVSLRLLDPYGPVATIKHAKGADWDEWPPDLRIREFPRSAVRMESAA